MSNFVGYVVQYHPRKKAITGAGSPRLSLTAQKNLMRRYVSDNLGQDIRFFEDKIKVATPTEFPELEQAIHHCHHNDTDLLVCEVWTIQMLIPLNVRLSKADMEGVRVHILAKEDGEYKIDPFSDKWVQLGLAMSRHFGLLYRGIHSRLTKEGMRKSDQVAGLGNEKRSYKGLDQTSPEYGRRRAKDVLRINSANASRHKKMSMRDERMRPILEEIIGAGITSTRQIALELNCRRFKPPRGKRWNHVTVGAMLDRLHLK